MAREKQSNNNHFFQCRLFGFLFSRYSVLEILGKKWKFENCKFACGNYGIVTLLCLRRLCVLNVNSFMSHVCLTFSDSLESSSCSTANHIFQLIYTFCCLNIWANVYIMLKHSFEFPLNINTVLPVKKQVWHVNKQNWLVLTLSSNWARNTF